MTAYHREMYGLEQYIEENGNAKSWYAVDTQENAKNVRSGVLSWLRVIQRSLPRLDRLLHFMHLFLFSFIELTGKLIEG